MALHLTSIDALFSLRFKPTAGMYLRLCSEKWTVVSCRSFKDGWLLITRLLFYKIHWCLIELFSIFSITFGLSLGFDPSFLLQFMFFSTFKHSLGSILFENFLVNLIWLTLSLYISSLRMIAIFLSLFVFTSKNP